jgi:hypothetical protein
MKTFAVLSLVAFIAFASAEFTVISTFEGNNCDPAKLISQTITPADAVFPCFTSACGPSGVAGESIDVVCVDAVTPPPQLAGNAFMNNSICGFENLTNALFGRLGLCKSSGIFSTIFTCDGNLATFKFCDDDKCSVNCFATTQDITQCNAFGDTSSISFCGNQPPFVPPVATTGAITTGVAGSATKTIASVLGVVIAVVALAAF